MTQTSAKGSAPPARSKVTPIGPPKVTGGRDGVVGDRSGHLDRQTSETFVGREREIDELRRSLENTLAGRGRLVLLAGEPGIGKTRLAQEIGAEAEEQGFQVLWGRCHEDEGVPPFWPWVQILRAHVRSRDTTTLRAELGPGAEDVAQIVADLRERFPDLPLPPAMESAAARFRLFDSVTTFLKNAADRQPLVLVLDDLHWADASSLSLLRFVAREMGSGRLLVVGTYRDAEVGREHPLFATLGTLAREPVSRRLRVPGLTPADVARYLQATAGVTPAAPLVESIIRDTAGNPFFIGEIARWLLAEGGQSAFHDRQSAVGIAPGVREVISRRLQRFSAECNELLQVAAVIGREFDVDVLEGTGGLTRERLLASLEEPLTSHLLMEMPGSLARYGFSHDLVRQTIYGELSLTRRQQLHRQVRDAMLARAESVGSGLPLAELAHHAFEAARGGSNADLNRAIEFTKRAGDQATQSLAYEEAASHYERALEALKRHPAGADERERLALLRALGVAAERADLPPEKATAALERAVELAERLGDAELQATTALDYHIAVRHGPLLDRCVQVPVLERALAALGPADSVLRVCLLAALVRANPRGHARELDLAREARAMAERIGDPEARFAALHALHAALLGPDHTEERLAISTEQLQLAEASQPGSLLPAAENLICDLCELGDMAEMDRVLRRVYRIIDERREFFWSGYKPLWSGMRAATEGRYEEAERLALELLEFAQRTRQANFERAVFGIFFELRRSQGRLAEIEPLVLYLSLEKPRDWWTVAWAALLHVEMGRADQARECLERLAEKDFVDIPRGWVFLPWMLRIATVAHRLHDERCCASLYDILRPYAARNIVEGYAVQCWGSVAFPLGMLTTTLGRFADAESHFESALAFNRKIGARPWLARTEYEYAAMLAARGRTEDQKKLRDLLARAVGTFDELGMKSDLERALELQSRIGDGSVSVLDTSADTRHLAPDTHPSSPAIFRREGDYWTIAYGNAVCRLRSTKGLEYVAHLLRHPGQEFHVLDLVQVSGARDQVPGVQHPTSGTQQPLLDAQAKSAYRHRLADLREELEEAEGFNDAGRAERVRAEIEFIAEQLAAAMGLGGRDRVAASAAERARSTVRQAIRTALENIKSELPALGDHLAARIKTGAFCVYRPDAARPVDWVF